jgi:hypothetical protein
VPRVVHLPHGKTARLTASGGVQLPLGLRAVLGYDAELCARAAHARMRFANELMRSLGWRSKKGVRDAFTGRPWRRSRAPAARPSRLRPAQLQQTAYRCRGSGPGARG